MRRKPLAPALSPWMRLSSVSTVVSRMTLVSGETRSASRATWAPSMFSMWMSVMRTSTRLDSRSSNIWSAHRVASRTWISSGGVRKDSRQVSAIASSSRSTTVMHSGSVAVRELIHLLAT